VVVVGAVVLRFKVVTTVEELADVSASGSFDDEFATWVVRSIVSSVEDKVVKKKKVTLSFSSNGVELIFSHRGNGSPELLELADVDLVTDFHACPRAKEENDDSNEEEVGAASKSDVLGFNTRCHTVDTKQQYEVADVLKSLKGSFLPCEDLSIS